MDIDFSNIKLDLLNPKNELQYQLYKCTLSLKQLADQLISFVTRAVESFLEAAKPVIRYLAKEARINPLIISREFAVAASFYPRLAYLACHAKKKRVRKKNVVRLYRIGCDILKRGCECVDS